MASHECAKCTYVAGAESVYYTPIQEKAARITAWDELLHSLGLRCLESKVVSLGYFVMPGWTNHIRMYLFECLQCEGLTVDYSHGFQLNLTCSHCKTQRSPQSSAYFKENGAEPPPTVWQQVRIIWKLRRDWKNS